MFHCYSSFLCQWHRYPRHESVATITTHSHAACYIFIPSTQKQHSKFAREHTQDVSSPPLSHSHRSTIDMTRHDTTRHDTTRHGMTSPRRECSRTLHRPSWGVLAASTPGCPRAYRTPAHSSSSPAEQIMAWHRAHTANQQRITQPDEKHRTHQQVLARNMIQRTVCNVLSFLACGREQDQHRLIEDDIASLHSREQPYCTYTCHTQKSDIHSTPNYNNWIARALTHLF